MSRHVALAPHLGVADLEKRYRAAHEPHEHSWWQILWLFAKGQTATAIAESTSYTLLDAELISSVSSCNLSSEVDIT